MNPEGTGALFHERSAWAQFATLAVVYTGVGIGILQDPTDPFRAAWLLGGSVVVLVLFHVLLHIVIAVRTPAEPDDERDAAIRLRSTRYSQMLLATGVLLCVTGLIVQQALASASGGSAAGIDPLWLHPLLAGYVLLLFFVASELVRLATRAVSYRRGI